MYKGSKIHKFCSECANIRMQMYINAFKTNNNNNKKLEKIVSFFKVYHHQGRQDNTIQMDEIRMIQAVHGIHFFDKIFKGTGQ